MHCTHYLSCHDHAGDLEIWSNHNLHHNCNQLTHSIRRTPLRCTSTDAGLRKVWVSQQRKALYIRISLRIRTIWRPGSTKRLEPRRSRRKIQSLALTLGILTNLKYEICSCMEAIADSRRVNGYGILWDVWKGMFTGFLRQKRIVSKCGEENSDLLSLWVNLDRREPLNIQQTFFSLLIDHKPLPTSSCINLRLRSFLRGR